MLEVDDVRATAEFYVERLGFEVTNTLEEPDGSWAWVNVRRGAVAFMFTERHTHADDPDADHTHPDEPVLTGSLYVNVDDVDALAAELAGRVILDFGPADQPHGMREIGVTDPNGYVLLFGQPL